MRLVPSGAHRSARPVCMHQDYERGSSVLIPEVLRVAWYHATCRLVSGDCARYARI
jgi:hypothetical protein